MERQEPSRSAPPAPYDVNKGLAMDPQTLSAVVQAIASLVAAVATVAIGVFAWRSYRTATTALDAARREADIAQKAVDAAGLSVVEARRQTQLARVPLVQLGRPKLAITPQGSKYLAIDATNLGPGHALELRLTVERQEAANGPFFSELRGARREPLLREGAAAEIQQDATDLANLNADWVEGMRAAGTGVALAHQPLVPVRLRIRLDYLTMLGASIHLVYLWETDRLQLPPDPWTWRLDRLTIAPSEGSGDPITVTRPD